MDNVTFSGFLAAILLSSSFAAIGNMAASDPVALILFLSFPILYWLTFWNRKYD